MDSSEEYGQFAASYLGWTWLQTVSRTQQQCKDEEILGRSSFHNGKFFGHFFSNLLGETSKNKNLTLFHP